MKEKYLDLARELKKLINMMTVIPIVIGASEIVFQNQEKRLEKLDIGGRIKPYKPLYC